MRGKRRAVQARAQHVGRHWEGRETSREAVGNVERWQCAGALEARRAAGPLCRAWLVGLHLRGSGEPRRVLGGTGKWSDSGFRKMSLDAERRLGGGTDHGVM